MVFADGHLGKTDISPNCCTCSAELGLLGAHPCPPAGHESAWRSLPGAGGTMPGLSVPAADSGRWPVGCLFPAVTLEPRLPLASNSCRLCDLRVSAAEAHFLAAPTCPLLGHQVCPWGCHHRVLKGEHGSGQRGVHAGARNTTSYKGACSRLWGAGVGHSYFCRCTETETERGGERLASARGALAPHAHELVVRAGCFQLVRY